MKKRCYLNYGGVKRPQSQDRSLHELQGLVHRKLCPWISPLSPTCYIRTVCLRTLWELGERARSAILHTADSLFSRLLWVQPRGREVNSLLHEEGVTPRGAGVALALLLTPQSPSAPPSILCFIMDN